MCRIDESLAPPTMEESFEQLVVALDFLKKCDHSLFKLEAQERALSHRLAVYLESLFNGCFCPATKLEKIEKRQMVWDVDCEYNRILDKGHKDPKGQLQSQMVAAVEDFRETARQDANDEWTKL